MEKYYYTITIYINGITVSRYEDEGGTFDKKLAKSHNAFESYEEADKVARAMAEASGITYNPWED